jgi:hypothetical protein
MEEKICSKCKVLQPINNFTKKKLNKDGLCSQCKLCVKEYRDKRSQDLNVIESRRLYRKNRPDELKKLDLLKKRAWKRNISLDDILKEENIFRENEKLNMKYCYTCLRTLDKSCFGKHKLTKDGLNTVCKECRINVTRKYYKDNFKSVMEQKKIYTKNNSVHILERQKKYTKDRKKKDPVFNLTINIRSRLRGYFKAKGISHKLSKSTQEIIGCSPQELREHIENKFVDGMSWDNYGYNGWHLDHIIPLCSGNNKEEIFKLNHYTNLQPLWAMDNMKKGGRINNINVLPYDNG